MSAFVPGQSGYEPGLDPGPEPEILILSERLRRDTHGVHAIVGSVASFNRLIVVRLPDETSLATPAEVRKRTRSVAEYRDVYRKFLLATIAFESSVLASLSESPATAAVLANPLYPRETPQSVALLRADLTTVFGEPVARRAVRMPSLPVIRTIADWVGTEYVRLGSRAGTAVIAAAVECNLGLDAERGASYLCRYGPDTRSHLERLNTWIDSYALTDEDADAAVHAAIRTFEGVGVWHRMFDAMTR